MSSRARRVDGSGWARRDRSLGLAVFVACGVAACEGAVQSPGAPALVASLVSNRFETTSVMRASLEMQLSGEPLAVALGYNLCGFNCTLTLTDQYAASCNSTYVTDPLGYALAVESFESPSSP